MVPDIRIPGLLSEDLIENCLPLLHHPRLELSPAMII